MMINLLVWLIVPLAVVAQDAAQLMRVAFVLRDDVRACRYQINDEKDDQWILVDMDEPLVEWVSTQGHRDLIFYQYTLDGRTWSDSFKFFFNTKTESWEHMFTPIVTSISEHPQSRAKRVSIGGDILSPLSPMPQSMFENGYGGTLRITQQTQVLSYYGQARYIFGDSPSELIDSIHTVMGEVGIGYQMYTGFIDVSTEIGGGLHIGAPIHSEHGCMWCLDGYGTVGASISRDISEDQDVFVRGNVLFLSGSDQVSVETAITAGTSFRL